jgi:pyruvate/2-oxoglutarate dehydrogenase complex dihydrolipoamide dehydrogenase (E3) component
VVDYAKVMERVRDVIRTIEPADSVERYTRLGVDVRLGHARILDPWTVEVDGERLTSRAIVIATGAEPIIPDIEGLREAGCLTSDTLWDGLASLPGRLVIIGGGPIGCELAQAFARLGSKVSLVELGPRILAKEDEEAAALMEKALRSEGVDIRTAHEALRCEGRALVVRDADQREHVLPFDAIIAAVGRRPRLAGFGLEELGIATDGRIETNGWLETIYPNIYAVGDVIGPYQLTHAAAHQAWSAAINALFGTFKRFKADYRVIPRVTFTDPELAQVGHDEASAAEAGLDVEVVRHDLDHLDRAVAEGANQGFVKLLVAKGKDRILGATILAHNGGELIAPIALAMRQGIGLDKILGTVHAYPTMAEANRYAAGVRRRRHAPERLLRIAEHYHRWRRG